jgi:hypothetical protein
MDGFLELTLPSLNRTRLQNLPEIVLHNFCPRDDDEKKLKGQVWD